MLDNYRSFSVKDTENARLHTEYVDQFMLDKDRSSSV